MLDLKSDNNIAGADPNWLDFARHCPSPNYDERPHNTDIDLLVIHAISLPPGEYGGRWIELLFLNQLPPGEHPYFKEIAEMRVSAHLLILRNGDLVQFMGMDKRAWHAGVSCFGEQERCNDFSIGIELEGSDDDPFTDEQYDCLGIATKAIQELYPAITDQRIVGHCDIAPGRKTDPGPRFDWGRYIKGAG